MPNTVDHPDLLLRTPLRKGFNNNTLAQGLFPDGDGHEAIELELEDPPIAMPGRGIFECKVVRPDPRYSHRPFFRWRNGSLSFRWILRENLAVL